MNISKRLFFSLLLLSSVVGMLLGAITLGALHSGGNGEAEIRVQAKRLADGRVEIGVQQREGNGWSTRILPPARFLAADAEAGRWFSSTPVSVSAPASISMRDAATRFDDIDTYRSFLEGGAFAPNQPVICLVSDGRGEERERICDYLNEHHDGEVTTLSSLNPGELLGQLNAALATSAARPIVVPTSLATTIVVVQAAGQERFDGIAYTREFRASRHAADDLFCVVGHSSFEGPLLADPFWGRLFNSVQMAGGDLKMSVQRIAHGNEGQADAIAECVDAGANVIATTLADVERVAGPIAAAQAAGITVITYNSGAESAARVGSAMHIALDDHRGGMIAGERFNAAGMQGKVLCLLHEENNIGLEQRCDGFAEAYGGEVERFSISALGSSQAVLGALIEQLSQPDPPVGLIALNSATGTLVGQALIATGADAVGATFGVNLENVSFVLSGTLLFLVEDHPLLQGYLTTAAMSFTNALEAPPATYLGGTTVYIAPRLVDRAVAFAFLQGLLAPR